MSMYSRDGQVKCWRPQFLISATRGGGHGGVVILKKYSPCHFILREQKLHSTVFKGAVTLPLKRMGGETGGG